MGVLVVLVVAPVMAMHVEGWWWDGPVCAACNLIEPHRPRGHIYLTAGAGAIGNCSQYDLSAALGASNLKIGEASAEGGVAITRISHSLSGPWMPFDID